MYIEKSVKRWTNYTHFISHPKTRKVTVENHYLILIVFDTSLWLDFEEEKPNWWTFKEPGEGLLENTGVTLGGLTLDTDGISRLLAGFPAMNNS